MVFKSLLLFIGIIWGTGILGALYYYLWKISDRKLKIKEKEIQNDTYNIFMKLDPKLAETAIDDLIQSKLDDYVVTNIIANDIQYMKKQHVEDMVKTLTKNLVLNMSEVYVFYCKIITNIDTDDDFIRFIHKKVKDHTLIFVTEFNKPI